MTDSIRVASLLPASTEILYAVGKGDCIVGISHECDFPAECRTKPVLTESKLDAHALSEEIQRDISKLIAESLSIYRIKTDLLRELKPNVIVTQHQCSVCAVSYDTVKEAVAKVAGGAPKIVSVSPSRLDDIFEDIYHISNAAGAVEEGKRLVEHMNERINEIGNLSRTADGRPTIAVLEWINPLMGSGNWMPELADLAESEHMFGDVGQRSLRIDWADLEKADPDIIVVAPCGFRLEQTMRELPQFTSHPSWSRLKAVQTSRAFAVDGNSYFNRPGPRIVDSLEILARITHPELMGDPAEDSRIHIIKG